MAREVRAYLEVGTRRVFACAVDWPGWARAGRTEEAAVEALRAYAARYAVVAAEAGERPPAPGAPVAIVGRVPGDATTDFGAPGRAGPTDGEPVDAAEAARLAGLLDAAWRVFDRVVAGAPAELRKGPRGGGRDRDKVVAHVYEAEAAYARTIGLRLAVPSDAASVAAFRQEVRAVLGAPSDGTPLAGKKWPLRYAVRRFAWHVLDHAWEVEDRSAP